ncbi:hypothetical protein D3C72_1488880 [compost metagenome]
MASQLGTCIAAAATMPQAIAPNRNAGRFPRSTVAPNHASTPASQNSKARTKSRAVVQPYSPWYSSMRCTAEAMITPRSASMAQASTRKTVSALGVFAPASPCSASSRGSARVVTVTSSKKPRRAYSAKVRPEDVAITAAPPKR